MLRVNTTVVALVNAADATLDRVAASNVAVHRSDAETSDLERAQAAWSAAHGAGRRYFVHRADPLAAVAAAWAREFDGPRVAGELEIARTETLTRWRAGSIALPDFYLIEAPDELPATERHWFLGVLAGRAMPNPWFGFFGAFTATLFMPLIGQGFSLVAGGAENRLAARIARLPLRWTNLFLLFLLVVVEAVAVSGGDF